MIFAASQLELQVVPPSPGCAKQSSAGRRSSFARICPTTRRTISPYTVLRPIKLQITSGVLQKSLEPFTPGLTNLADRNAHACVPGIVVHGTHSTSTSTAGAGVHVWRQQKNI